MQEFTPLRLISPPEELIIIIFPFTWVLTLYTNLIHRDFQKAADTAFQDRSMKELEEVEIKVIRFPDLSDYIKVLKSKLGYR